MNFKKEETKKLLEKLKITLSGDDKVRQCAILIFLSLKEFIYMFAPITYLYPLTRPGSAVISSIVKKCMTCSEAIVHFFQNYNQD